MLNNAVLKGSFDLCQYIILLIIASYASYNEAEVKNYTPTLCYVDANNVLTQIKATL
jgi:aspartate 1-decarboxylase